MQSNRNMTLQLGHESKYLPCRPLVDKQNPTHISFESHYIFSLIIILKIIIFFIHLTCLIANDQDPILYFHLHLVFSI